MNSVLLVNFVPWRFETGVEDLDLDQQKTWEQRKPAERRRHKTSKMLGNIFHQIDGLMMIFPGEFSKLWCACFISIFIESSEIIRDTRRGASQSNWGLGVVGVTWLQEVERQQFCGENQGNKPPMFGGVRSCCGSGSLGLERAKRWLACLFVVCWVLVLFLWKNWLSFFEAMLACFLFIFSSGLFVVGSLRVAFFGAHPLGQQDLVGSPLFPAAPLAGCRRQVKLTPCPWGQPIGFCERKQIRWMTARRMG